QRDRWGGNDFVSYSFLPISLIILVDITPNRSNTIASAAQIRVLFEGPALAAWALVCAIETIAPKATGLTEDILSLKLIRSYTGAETPLAPKFNLYDLPFCKYAMRL